MKRKLWFAAVIVMMAVLWCAVATAGEYDLYIDGVQVTDLNRSDILGNGRFTYSPPSNTLSMWGAYEAESDCVINSSLDGLEIRGYNANLSCPGKAMQLAGSSLMSGNWTITSGGNAIYAGDGCTLTIDERSKLTVSAAGQGLYGCVKGGRTPEYTSTLVIDRSFLTVTAGSGKSAIGDFKSISFTKSTVTAPSGAIVRLGTIYTSMNETASHVEIQGPPDPVVLSDLMTGITGLWKSGIYWCAQAGTMISFTEESLADADATFGAAFLEGKEFTYQYYKPGHNETTAVTADSSGVFSYEVPENATGVVLEILDDGEIVYFSEQIDISADGQPAMPRDPGWSGMTAQWSVPWAGTPDSYTVRLYHADDSPATAVKITPAGGILAVSYDFESSFPAFGQGDYYFTVTAEYADGREGCSDRSPVYRYTGDADFYTMFFEPGDGTGTMTNVTLNPGDSFTLPASTYTAPAGMVFKGWKNRGDGYAPGYTFTVGCNETFTALWTADTSEVLRYAAEVEEVSFTLYADYAPQTQETQYIKIRNTGTVRLLNPELTISGSGAAAFNFWQGLYPGLIEPGACCEAWMLRAVANLTPGTYRATLTLTADFIQPVTGTVKLIVTEENTPEPDFYTMYFEAGEGSGTMASVTVDAGDSFTLPASTFTAPAGKIFKGWENRGSGYAPGYTITAGSNETFTALWTSDPSEVLCYGAEMDNVSFTLKAGYSYEGQTAQLITVRNTGTVRLNNPALSLTGTNASAFEMRAASYLSLIEPKTEWKSWAIKAARDVAPGTYTADLTFTADCIQPVTATVTLVVSDHQITPGVWASDNEYHWNVCSECSEQVNLAHHDGGEIRNAAEATFDADGYSGDLCCTVCGYILQRGHIVSAGKYIRESAATMVPATLTNAMCAGDLTVTSADPSKYTAVLGRVIDTTDISLNVNGVYPSDRYFVKGHTYYIEIEFTAVSPYVYDEEHSDYWSTYTLNGAEIVHSNATLLSGSTVRKTELSAQDAGRPVIQAQPADQTVPEGQEAVFSVTATGGALTYQWMYSDDGGTVWRNCTEASAKTAELRVTAAMGTDGRMFHCVITNTSGSTVSQDARILIKPTKLSTPDFVLPEQLAQIEPEAFSGISAQVVYVPDGCTKISALAFADCAGLKQIRIPAGCTIETDAFKGCGKVFVFSAAGSHAEIYCQVYSNLYFVEEQP